MENKKVLLGMSGGVDSSVSALLLKQQGYEVIGTTLELFAGSSCCNINTYIDAKNVCSSIGVPHFTYDYKEEFKKHVIDDFINCYANCKTPNPCIECNKYLKFGAMYEKAKELGVTPMATWVAGALGGVEPEIMGVGPVASTKKVLAKTGMSIDDFDLIEANEAFAAQSVAVAHDLGFNNDILNVNGGAIALGHPVGASGCRILVTLLHEMEKRDAKKGLATLCVGGGMGCAAIVERE